MTSYLLYLLEASLVLVILYGAYRLLLSKETFFSFNRFFLMGILILSLLFPLISFEVGDSGDSFINQQSTELSKARSSYHTTIENWSGRSTSSEDIETSWWQQFWSQEWDAWRVLMVAIIAIYGIGLAYRLFQLSSGYVKVYRLKRQLSSTDFEGCKVAEIPSHLAPFSFLNTVFIPESIEDEREYSQILAHERTHIRQRHSIDLIFVQLVAALLWFNPVVWLLIKSLKQTHEYIADKNMLRQGFSLVEYQSLLLRQLISDNSYGLVHNFNLSFIKKRITMMSIKESGWTGKSKAVVALSFILLMGVMTAQSNTMLDMPALVTNDAARAETIEMKFYIDGVSLSEGLQFSRLKGYKGEFKFAFENSTQDNIHVGLDLLRKGKVVGHANQKLQEKASFNIKELLNKAQRGDYLVVDIIDGPSDAVKLYNFALFREGEEKRSGNDLPPSPPPSLVKLTLGGFEVSSQKSLSLTNLKKRGLRGDLKYELSDFVDFDVISEQGGDVTTTLMRNGEAVKSITSEGVKRKATIRIYALLNMVRKGDMITVQFGKSGGLRFGTQFLIE